MDTDSSVTTYPGNIKLEWRLIDVIFFPDRFMEPNIVFPLHLGKNGFIWTGEAPYCSRIPSQNFVTESISVALIRCAITANI